MRAGATHDNGFAVARSPDHRMRRGALFALMGQTDPRAVASFCRAMSDPEVSVRRAAVRALGRVDDPGVAKWFLAALDDPDAQVRGHAVLMLLRQGRNGERYVLLVNYESRAATVELALHGELADPRLLILDAQGAHEGALKGTSSAASLERMAVTVPGESAVVVCVVAATDRHEEEGSAP